MGGDLRTLDADSAATFPGRPELLHTPGHTQGHCALHFNERGTVLTGDSLVTLDPYTGASGPQIVSAAATADTRLALKSQDVLAGTGAETALPGHGLPYYGSIAAAVQQARRHGAT